jgi:DNA-binding MurR/RpiR family transcriptional regulator
MTTAQKKIGNYILHNANSVIHMSISELAEKSDAKSESAIVRFYRRLGYSGYHNFKVTLTMQLAGHSFYHSIKEITESDDINSIKQKIFNGTLQTFQENITSLSDSLLLDAVKLIEESKRLIFIGYAISGTIAATANFMFTRLGFSCCYSPDSHFNAVLLTDPRPGDVIFCISNSGESKDVVLPVEHSNPPARVIALTSSRESPLGKVADICLETVSEEVNYWGDPFIARLVELAIIDLLYVAVGLRRSPGVFEHLANTQQSLSYLKL